MNLDSLKNHISEKKYKWDNSSIDDIFTSFINRNFNKNNIVDILHLIEKGVEFEIKEFVEIENIYEFIITNYHEYDEYTITDKDDIYLKYLNLDNIKSELIDSLSSQYSKIEFDSIKIPDEITENIKQDKELDLIITAFNKRLIMPENINQIIILCDYLNIINSKEFILSNSLPFYCKYKIYENPIIDNEELIFKIPNHYHKDLKYKKFFKYLSRNKMAWWFVDQFKYRSEEFLINVNQHQNINMIELLKLSYIVKEIFPLLLKYDQYLYKRSRLFQEAIYIYWKNILTAILILDDIEYFKYFMENNIFEEDFTLESIILNCKVNIKNYFFTNHGLYINEKCLSPYLFSELLDNPSNFNNLKNVSIYPRNLKYNLDTFLEIYSKLNNIKENYIIDIRDLFKIKINETNYNKIFKILRYEKLNYVKNSSKIYISFVDKNFIKYNEIFEYCFNLDLIEIDNQLIDIIIKNDKIVYFELLHKKNNIEINESIFIKAINYESMNIFDYMIQNNFKIEKDYLNYTLCNKTSYFFDYLTKNYNFERNKILIERIDEYYSEYYHYMLNYLTYSDNMLSNLKKIYDFKYNFYKDFYQKKKNRHKIWDYSNLNNLLSFLFNHHGPSDYYFNISFTNTKYFNQIFNDILNVVDFMLDNYYKINYNDQVYYRIFDTYDYTNKWKPGYFEDYQNFNSLQFDNYVKFYKKLLLKDNTIDHNYFDCFAGFGNIELLKIINSKIKLQYTTTAFDKLCKNKNIDCIKYILSLGYLPEKKYLKIALDDYKYDLFVFYYNYFKENNINIKKDLKKLIKYSFIRSCVRKYNHISDFYDEVADRITKNEKIKISKKFLLFFIKNKLPNYRYYNQLLVKFYFTNFEKYYLKTFFDKLK